jgi:hypothetical protein
MRKLINISVILFLIFATGCDSPQIACTTGPVSLTFEFVDQDSGANLFENGTFDRTKPVTITDLNQNKLIKSTYMNSNDGNLLRLLVGFEPGTFNYAIKYEDKAAFEISVVTERVKGEYCTNTVLKSSEIKNATYDDKTGLIKILINTKN